MGETGEGGFGNLLRRYRVAAGLTQEQLAERTGLSARGISDLERGARGLPRRDTLRLLLDGLDLSSANRAALAGAARRPAPATSHRPRSDPRADLPVPPTPLVGREAEIAVVSALLSEPASRLLTLTGPGGVGKTRLALAVADQMAPSFADGARFVPLASVGDPVFVAAAIALRLDLSETTGRPLIERIAAHLANKRLLLVLDNFEHLLPAAPLIADLIALCPALMVLVTSRAPLHIMAERTYAVPPLGLPSQGRLPPLDELAKAEAVRLFVARVRAVQPDFALTETNAAAVAEIVVRLDGLPLALELAAARIRILSPPALLARLDRRLPLLAGGSRDLPSRQRTMRDAIAWSYDLLSPDEQAIFRRLAVFAGGFSLEAAESVADLDDGDAVLDGVTALVEQSLLHRGAEFGDEPRYLMLETVREFGLEQLQAAREVDGASERHAAHFLALIDRLPQTFQIFQSRTSLAPIAADRDNLRRALTWFDDRGDAAAQLRLNVALYGLDFAPGLYREGLEWLERALERSRHVASAARVKAFAAASTLSGFLGDYDHAATFIAEGLALARKLKDPLLIGQALMLAGWMSYRRGEYAEAEDLLGDAHRRLGELVDQGPDAMTVAAIALLILGDNALAQEQFERAARRYEAAHALFEATGNDLWLCDARAGLGGASYCRGDIRVAAARYQTILERVKDLGFPMYVASCFLGLAGVASAAGRPAEGARLFGAAEGMAAARAAPIYPRDRPVRDRVLATLTAALGQARLTAAREEGRTLGLDEAMAEAQTVTEVARSATFEDK